MCFALGSVLAALAQGLMLGAIVNGLPLVNGAYQAGVWHWFSPFSMLTGVAVVFGDALLGSSTWLIFKTEGALQNVLFALTRPLVAVVVAFMGLVSGSLPFLSSQILARWFESGNFLWLSPVPVRALVNAVALWRAVMRRAELAPFLLAIAFFALGFLGFVVGIWPNLPPPDLDIWQAASPPSSQGFVRVGYTWRSYTVFRGKVRGEGGLLSGSSCSELTSRTYLTSSMSHTSKASVRCPARTGRDRRLHSRPTPKA